MFTLNMLLQTVAVYVANAFKREEGQDFAEYALIFALVVIIAMAGLVTLGPNILTQFTTVAAAL